MKKLAVCLLIALCSTTAFGDLQWWASTQYNGGRNDLFMLDTYNEDAFGPVWTYWGELPGTRTTAFEDNGQFWYMNNATTDNRYVGVSLGLSKLQPVAQGGTIETLATWQFGVGVLANMPAGPGPVAMLKDPNSSDLLFMTYELLPGGPGVGGPAQAYKFGKITLDAAGNPTGVVMGSSYANADTKTPMWGGLSTDGTYFYSSPNNRAYRIPVADFMSPTGTWTTLAVSSLTDDSLGATMINEAGTAIFWAKMTNTTVHKVNLPGGDNSGTPMPAVDFGSITPAPVTGFGGASLVRIVPEPATLALLAMGGLALIRRRAVR